VNKSLLKVLVPWLNDLAVDFDVEFVEIKGTMVKVNAQAKFEAKGALADVNASGMLTLKGSLTKIN
jgi:hypothetical protein